MTPDARAIAAKLTKAQRDAVLWLPADGTRRPWGGASSDRDVHRDLRCLGLGDGKIDRTTSMMMRWATPLGRAVREILVQEQNHG
jgi:hypothetical protein